MSAWPVTNEALSDATKTTARAISSGRPIRPGGEAPSIDLVLGLLPVIATHIEQVASGGDLGPCRAWRSAAFLTTLADSSRKVAGGGQDGSQPFYQIWEYWMLCDTRGGNRVFLSRPLLSLPHGPRLSQFSHQ